MEKQPSNAEAGQAPATRSVTRLSKTLGAALTLVALLAGGCGKTPEAAPTTKKEPKGGGAADTTAATPNSGTNSLAVRSVFVADLDLGKDPFFPQLKKKEPEAATNAAAQRPAATPSAMLEVKNILQYGGKMVARVNDAILEPGRSSAVTTKNGERWRVFCVSVTSEAVTVRIEGQGNTPIVLPANGR